MVSLYFHIPFCSKKCPYCHFYVIPNKSAFHQILAEGLQLEIQKQAPLLEGKTVTSLYFGGGTPSLFAPQGIAKIFQYLSDSRISLSKDCEITLEANPEEVSPFLFEQLLQMGVNRLSLGVQSLDDRSLQTLERIHSAKTAKQAISQAHLAGFANISIDLMYDLPSQTRACWEKTLEELENLPIQHLSLYNLTIEPHTSFAKRKDKLQLPPPETSLHFLESAIQTLEKLGLKRYEIASFAKEGFSSRHNMGYWTGRPFLGFGPSAFSFWDKARFRNMANLQRYTRDLKEGKSPVDFHEKLEFTDHLKEMLAIQLRLIQGTTLDPNLPLDTKNTIADLIQKNLIKQESEIIKLTKKGLLFHDMIASEII